MVSENSREDYTSYRISIDGQWDLKDLADFPRVYSQLYAFSYWFVRGRTNAHYEYAFQAFPWRGGYSAVNFYNSLYAAIPRRERPRMVRFEYASPGFIELALVLGAAYFIKRIVSAVGDAVEKGDRTYTHIQRGLSERKLLRMETRSREIELDLEEQRYVIESLDNLKSLMHATDELEQLEAQVDDPLISLKMLSSLYRRSRDVSEMIRADKIRLDGDDDVSDHERTHHSE